MAESEQQCLQVMNPNENGFRSSPFPPILNYRLINLFSFLRTLPKASSWDQITNDSRIPYCITNAATMIISQTSEVTFYKRIHSKWRQVISNIKKDGLVSYVTIQFRVKQDKVIVYMDVPSLLGAYVELRRFGGAQVLTRLDSARGLQI